MEIEKKDKITLTKGNLGRLCIMSEISFVLNQEDTYYLC